MGALLSTASDFWQTLTRRHALQQAPQMHVDEDGNICIIKQTHHHLRAHSEIMATSEATRRTITMNAINAPTNLETCTNQREGKVHLLAKAHYVNLTHSMHTFDEELLKHLREIQNAWRRGLDDSVLLKDCRGLRQFPLRSLQRACSEQSQNVDANSRIDALNDRFKPTLRARRKSEDSDVSELDLDHPATLSDAEEQKEQETLQRRASAPAKRPLDRNTLHTTC